MPWGEKLGQLPPMRPVDGARLLAMIAATRVHHVVGADELEAEPTQEPWHDFADLMRDACDSAADLDADDSEHLADEIEALIGALRDLGVTVLAGREGAFLYVAVVRQVRRRDLVKMFARS